MSIFRKLINKINKKRQKALHEKCLRMNSEIICAIVHEVRKEQEKQSVSLPAFFEVQNIYDSLKLKTHKDVVNAYRLFYERGLVSGINL